MIPNLSRSIVQLGYTSDTRTWVCPSPRLPQSLGGSAWTPKASGSCHTSYDSRPFVSDPYPLTYVKQSTAKNHNVERRTQQSTRQRGMMRNDARNVSRGTS
eukprot:1702840-Pyramimonas_sp.AAC.1